MLKRSILSSIAVFLIYSPSAHAQSPGLESLIAQHAAANDVPVELVHRIVKRESNYNSGALGRGGALGLMQIKHATARGMGYMGSASGLLDADTNLTYAVRYLAGAYRVAGGNQSRAVAYYASGYYYAAKRQGLTSAIAQRPAPALRSVGAAATETTASLQGARVEAMPMQYDMR